MTKEQHQARLDRTRKRYWRDGWPEQNRKRCREWKQKLTPEQLEKYRQLRKAKWSLMTPEQRQAKRDYVNVRYKNRSPEQKAIESAKRIAIWNSLSEEERRRRIAKMKTYDSQHGEKRAMKRRQDVQQRIVARACASSFSCHAPLAGTTRFCLKHWLRSIAAAEKRSVGKCPLSLLLKIWDEQDGVCPITGIRLTPGKDANLDHIIPVGRGGDHSENNLRFVHVVFNKMKEAMLDSELKAFLRVAGPRLLEWAK